jgi:hypothetical protein
MILEDRASASRGGGSRHEPPRAAGEAPTHLPTSPTLRRALLAGRAARASGSQ